MRKYFSTTTLTHFMAAFHLCKSYLSKTGSSILCLFFFCSFLSAQSVGENCDNGKCDNGLHCVEAYNTDTKRTEDFCSSCTQSELNSKTNLVTDKCKWYQGKPGQGWYPKKNPTYLKYVSDADPNQDRAAVEAFDELLEESKECEEAREDRDNDCWGGGDAGHIAQRKAVKAMNTSIGELKRDAINNKEVYYCSKSTYESSMSNYNSKCGNLENLAKIP